MGFFKFFLNCENPRCNRNLHSFFQGNTAQFPPYGLSTAPADLRAKSRRKRRLRSEAPRCGSVCGTASALPKCSIMSGCGPRIVLRGQKPLALCDRCPCFGSLYPPLAALTFAASSIICAFGLASAAPRSPYRHLELCGIALDAQGFLCYTVSVLLWRGAGHAGFGNRPRLRHCGLGGH